MKKNPDNLIDLVETLWTENHYLKNEVEKLKGNLLKYTSPHIPNSKRLYPKNKKNKQSGLPNESKGRRGGSKKGNSGPTWDQKEPDKVINSHVS